MVEKLYIGQCSIDETEAKSAPSIVDWTKGQCSMAYIHTKIWIKYI